MNWRKRIRREVSVGFFIGAVCLTGILYFLLKTEERAQELYYRGIIPESSLSLMLNGL